MHNDFFIISGKCADVLRRFDLGRTSLYPTKVLEVDRTTPLPGEYFCINLGETKDCVVVEKSDVKPWTDRYSARAGFKDGAFTLRKTALDGVDLWVDPMVVFPVFLSGRLVAALRKARIDKPFHLCQCIVE